LATCLDHVLSSWEEFGSQSKFGEYLDPDWPSLQAEYSRDLYLFRQTYPTVGIQQMLECLPLAAADLNAVPGDFVLMVYVIRYT